MKISATMRAARRMAELQEQKRLEREPLVRAVLDRFPGAEVVSVRNASTLAGILPYADSIYILKHGTKAYHAMKSAVDTEAGAHSAPPPRSL